VSRNPARGLALASLCVLLLGCSLTGRGTPPADPSTVGTAVAATLRALTPSALPTRAFEGVGFEAAPLSGTLPPGLGTAVVDEITADMEFPICANPSCGDTPPHHRYTIQNYQYMGSDLAPKILVFGAAEFAGFTDFNPEKIAALQALKDQPNSIPSDTPHSSFFRVRTQAINFQDGYGVRKLGQVNEGVSPINNQHFFYYFEGLTGDGQYYVSAVLPVSAPFLVADDHPTSPFPPEAVPFDWQGAGTFDLSKYYESVAQQLNAAAAEAFIPDLDKLDAFVQSLQVSP